MWFFAPKALKRVLRPLLGQSGWFLTAVACLLIFNQDDRADNEGDLLQTVRTHHRAASELIRSFAATFQCEATYPKAEAISRGDYRRSLGTVRIHEGVEGQWTSDILIANGETRIVGTNLTSANQREYRAERASSAQMVGLSDMWMGMLMVIVGPKGQPMSIDRILESAKRPPSATKVTEDGRKCVRVSIDYDEADGREVQLTLWHDIDCNYLVRKRTVTTKGTDWRSVSTVTEFAEPAPGVFVPSKCRGQTFVESKLVKEWLITMSGLSVNFEVRPNVLQLPAFPSGTVLHDRINETKYQIDSEWHQIGPASPDRVLKVASPSPGQSDFTSQSRSEPTPSARRLISLSLALLVGIAIYVAFRMRHRSLTLQ